jgi:hypothetical protein
MNNAFELIPLTVEARGEVITSNVAEFRELVRNALGNLNRSPETDEEFGQAEQDAKALKGAEERIMEAKDKALSDAEGLYQLLAELDETSVEIRSARLELEKQINLRKEEIKAQIVEESLAQFDLEPEVARQHFRGDVLNAIKGKRTLDSIRKAAEVFVLTRNAVILKSREKIAFYVKAHGNATVPDADTLELRNPDVVEAELKRRFDAAKAAEEKKRMEAELAAERKRNDEIRGPKIGSIPVGAAAKAQAAATPAPESAPLTLSNEVSPAEEWFSFQRAALEAFQPLKAAKAALQHPANIERAARFAAGVNAAWKQLKEEGVTA